MCPWMYVRCSIVLIFPHMHVSWGKRESYKVLANLYPTALCLSSSSHQGKCRDFPTGVGIDTVVMDGR